MIVAELVASGELVNPHEMAREPQRRVAADAARRASASIAGLAIGPAVLHEPKRRDPPGRRRGRRGRAASGCATRSRRCSRRSTGWSMRSRGLGAGEHRDIIETYRMFAADRGWLGAHHRGGAQRPDRRGRGAEGARRDQQPHDAGQPTRICASGCTISKTSPTGCSNSWPGRRRRAPPPAELPAEFILVAACDGAGRAAGLRASPHQGAGARGRLADRACRDRRARLRHPGRRPGRRTRRSGSSRATSSSSTATTAGADPAARRHPADGRRQRSRRAPSAAPIYETLRDTPAVTRDGVAVTAAAQCRAAARSGAAGGDRRRRDRAVPHRDPASDAQRLSRRRRPDRLLPPRLRAGRRAGRSCSARSISAATRCCPISPIPPRTTRRWAGARSASGSTGRRCCASSCARCCAPPAGAICASSSR